MTERLNLLPVSYVFEVEYFDGQHHTVRARPGDVTRLEDEFGPAWRGDGNIGPKPMLYLAWLASRHDPSGMARPDFDTFRDDATSIELGIQEVRPTNAAPGNGSPSNLRLPPAANPVDGSTPTPAPL